MKTSRLVLASALTFVSLVAHSRGVSPYLPSNLDPEIEWQIERVLILADKPVLTRPIAAAVVLDALPAACSREPELCQQVRRYLSRYTHRAGISLANAEVFSSDDTPKSVANRRGLDLTDEWSASARAYWQPANHLLLSLGAVADPDGTVVDGTLLSIGFDRAQLDIGYREHWFSPLTDSSMLISSHAESMASVTLSNYTPLTRFGIRYEAFVSEMARSDRIAFDSTFTTGRPRLAGLHLSVEPATGWALGFNRLMQYAGGDRGGTSFRELLDAFFRPSRFDNVSSGAGEEFGNQLASITSEFVFPGEVPFSVYFEYAGEDTSRGRNYLLGNAALSAGIHFPRLWRDLSLTYEVSEWQNGWYVSAVYGDGLTNEGNVIGHWGGDERVVGDAVGAQSHMLQLAWNMFFGEAAIKFRTLANESYSATDYEQAHEVMLRYSRPIAHVRIGAEIFAGRDVFGRSFSSGGLFVRYSDDARRPSTGSAIGRYDRDAHIFVDAGLNVSRVSVDLDDSIPIQVQHAGAAPHFAIGARRAVSDRSDLGARLELDDVDGRTLLGVRAIDYRYRFANAAAFTLFVGAARYDLASPAYGIYYGIGGQWRDVFPSWDLAVDLRYASKVARDKLLPSDPLGQRVDSFYDIESATVSISRRF